MNLKAIHDNLSDKIKSDIKAHVREGVIGKVTYQSLASSNPLSNIMNNMVVRVSMDKTSHEYEENGVCPEYAQLVLYTIRGYKKDEDLTRHEIFREINEVYSTVQST